MSYKLFLDDVRNPNTTFSYMELPVFLEPDWIIVRNYDAFISLIQSKGVPEVIAFDHDLADVHYHRMTVDISYTCQQFQYDLDDEKTGYHCAKWFIDYCIDNKEKLPNEIIVHSMNPSGSKNIKSLFDTYIKVYDLEHGAVKMNPYIRN